MTMIPAFETGHVTVYLGHVLDILRKMPAESVDCVVTSPPYWGLRAYGTEAQAWGGDPAHEHAWGAMERGKRADLLPADQTKSVGRLGTIEESNKGALDGGRFCSCGAWRGELGLEPTPDLYVEHIVAVFREVRRVMRPAATLWLNLGDSYCAGGNGARNVEWGLKPKDLVGVPWRVAFALQADGWWLRSEITWCKSNCMPESVTDRPTTATEKVFLLAKQSRYYFDADAIAEPFANSSLERITQPTFWKQQGGEKDYGEGSNELLARGRSARNYWLIHPQRYSGAHFATFPEELARRCIKAGTSERGNCGECGKPWTRDIDVTYTPAGPAGEYGGPKIAFGERASGDLERGAYRPQEMRYGRAYKTVTTAGWQRSCAHSEAATVFAVVFDPFAGSGTTLAVARDLGRRAIGIELKPEYLKLIEVRCAQGALSL